MTFERHIFVEIYYTKILRLFIHNINIYVFIDSYKITTVIENFDLGYSLAASLNNRTAFQPPVNR